MAGHVQEEFRVSGVIATVAPRMGRIVTVRLPAQVEANPI
jgi:hypothetical protein